ncbi:hypothetical protein SY86_00345 [Erwinia tracheiphila]|uniref:Uncharacterized protein n=1 Tax=Erwinia tracheiphila TaxID=65700 RepID=A0A0M2KF76_9GAMM|nr:hypothetical protein AV903_01945 [Erwinia tracheiphila]KKF38030.1 hypothetical protein SY86_00345 [Erwinia tracheiphila]
MVRTEGVFSSGGIPAVKRPVAIGCLATGAVRTLIRSTLYQQAVNLSGSGSRIATDYFAAA